MAKQRHIEEQLEKKQAQRERDRQRRKLEAMNRAAKAERIRAAKMYQKKQLIHKLNDDWVRWIETYNVEFLFLFRLA